MFNQDFGVIVDYGECYGCIEKNYTSLFYSSFNDFNVLCSSEPYLSPRTILIWIVKSGNSFSYGIDVVTTYVLDREMSKIVRIMKFMKLKYVNEIDS